MRLVVLEVSHQSETWIKHHDDSWAVLGPGPYLMCLVVMMSAPWLAWNLYPAFQAIVAFYRRALRRRLLRQEDRRRAEEKLLARYWSVGQPVGSTADEGEASNGANLPRETPCVPSPSPQPLCSP